MKKINDEVFCLDGSGNMCPIKNSWVLGFSPCNLTNDGREFKVCPNCFAYIMINNSCMGAKVKRCRLGVQIGL